MFSAATLLSILASCAGSPIVGGRISQLIPYQASIELDGKHGCGGVIISNRFILTAAHCVIKGNYSIRAGTTIRGSGGISVKVAYAQIHPNYDEATLNNDVALLYMENTLSFNSRVNRVELIAANEDIKPGEEATISGWGFRNEDFRNLSQNLMTTTVPIISREDCSEKIYFLTESMLCAGYLDGRRDSCIGDSGGPMVIKDKLVGIISSGLGCAREDLYGVYTSVAFIREWIDRTVADFTDFIKKKKCKKSENFITYMDCS